MIIMIMMIMMIRRNEGSGEMCCYDDVWVRSIGGWWWGACRRREEERELFLEWWTIRDGGRWGGGWGWWWTIIITGSCFSLAVTQGTDIDIARGLSITKHYNHHHHHRYYHHHHHHHHAHSFIHDLPTYGDSLEQAHESFRQHTGSSMMIAWLVHVCVCLW